MRRLFSNVKVLETIKLERDHILFRRLYTELTEVLVADIKKRARTSFGLPLLPLPHEVATQRPLTYTFVPLAGLELIVLDKNLYSKSGITYTCLVKFPDGRIEGRLFTLVSLADEDIELEVETEPDPVLVSAGILSLKEVHQLSGSFLPM